MQGLIASHVLSHPHLFLTNLLMIIMPILSSHFAKSQTGDASSSGVPVLHTHFPPILIFLPGKMSIY
jgi:cytochrome bd-type quinol oxidase subunit 2